MTEGPGRNDDDLTVFDAPEPVDGGSSGATRGTTRPTRPPRGAAVAVAVLAVLVAGIAFGSLPKQDPNPSGSTRPSSSIDVAASPVRATRQPCRPPAPGDPGLSLGRPGRGTAVAGAFAYQYDAAIATPPLPASEPWPAIPVDDALEVEALEDLALIVDAGQCLRRVVLTYLRTGSPPDGVEPDSSVTYTPPSQVGQIIGPQDGDWLLRIQAHLEVPGDLATAADPVVVTYFRMVVGGGPVVGPSGALPTPLVTPAVPCPTATPDASIAVSLLGGPGDPVPGAAVDFAPAPAPPDAPPSIPPSVPAVKVGLGDPVSIAVDGEACAVSWDIELVDPATGLGGTAELVPNAADDPSVAAQNRWDLNLPDTDQLVVAHLHFANGPSIVRSWLVTVQPFQVPAASLVGPDGSRFQATAGCGLSLSLVSGYNLSDGCGGTGYEPTDAALKVPAWQPVTFEIPGWSLQSWNGHCGTIETGGTSTFKIVSGCSLGSAVSDDGQPLTTPTVFLIPPGDHVVALFVTAFDANGNQFSITYYARVIAR